MANALWVWGAARLSGGAVILRIEDHDRQRSRPVFAAGILDDLTWLGFRADDGPLGQGGDEAIAAYEAALDRLRAVDRVYACDCTRATVAAWATAHGRPWHGPGCPGGCRERRLMRPGLPLRVDLGEDDERFDDLRLGARSGSVAPTGDLVARDRHGGWSYGFAVAVDDHRQGVDLVIRGEDLLEATPGQIRLARLLGRDEGPRFLHHPLIRKPGGAKLSKSDDDTGVRDLRAAGWSPSRVLAEAARRGEVPAELVAANAFQD